MNNIKKHLERNQESDILGTIFFTKYSSFIFINETVTNRKKIANIFNDYFSTIAEKTKAKIKFSNKLFDELLQHANETSFSLKPTSSDEII